MYKSNCLKSIIGKILKSQIKNIDFKSWKLFHASIGYLVQLLSNLSATFSYKNLDSIRKLEGWDLTLVAYKKSIALKKGMVVGQENGF